MAEGSDLDGVEAPIDRARGLGSLIRDHADQADRECRLPAPVAEAFARTGLYRIAAPTDLSGLDADPLTQIEVIEAVSAADGSAGWNLMIGIETFGLLAPGCQSCRHLIEDPMIVMSSSTAAVGRADREGESFRVNGRWQFVSGCQNSSVFGATVRLYEGGEPVSQNLYAIVPAPDFEIIETWDVGGMRGSGSHDVVVAEVLVPESQIVAPLGGADSDSAQLRIPLGARLAYNKVAVALGIARAGIDAFVDLAEGKVPRFSSRSLRERPSAQRAVAEAEVRLLGARALVFDLVEALWEKARTGAHITTKERAIFQLACSDAVRGAVAAVDAVSDAAGTTANQRSHPLERIGRDVRVVRQHVTVANYQIEDVGRVLLGLPPEGLMLAGMRN
jgi:alkylation response protein AidB-like acyl-CoA dehydrogenase